MANIKKGNLTPASQWWKHLKEYKRISWKREFLSRVHSDWPFDEKAYGKGIREGAEWTELIKSSPDA